MSEQPKPEKLAPSPIQATDNGAVGGRDTKAAKADRATVKGISLTQAQTETQHLNYLTTVIART